MDLISYILAPTPSSELEGGFQPTCTIVRAYDADLSMLKWKLSRNAATVRTQTRVLIYESDSVLSTRGGGRCIEWCCHR